MVVDFIPKYNWNVETKPLLIGEQIEDFHSDYWTYQDLSVMLFVGFLGDTWINMNILKKSLGIHKIIPVLNINFATVWCM